MSLELQNNKMARSTTQIGGSRLCDDVKVFIVTVSCRQPDCWLLTAFLLTVQIITLSQRGGEAKLVFFDTGCIIFYLTSP